MKLIKDLSNLRDAYRVLQIMDEAGVDIYETDIDGMYRLEPKWYVSKKDAEDLEKIVLFKDHYKNPPKWLHKIFYRRFHYGSRDFY